MSTAKLVCENRKRDNRRLWGIATSLTILLCFAPNANAQQYRQTNLVSDIPGLATFTDLNLANPWGLARSAGSPWWVADNVTGVQLSIMELVNPFPLIVRWS